MCLLIPCSFFGFGCVFASAGLLGLDWGAGQRLLQQSLGVCPTAQPLLPRCLTQDPRGSDNGALPLSPLHSLGFACLCKAWADPVAGQVKRGAIPEHRPPPTASVPTASGHGWQTCRDHRVTRCPQVSSFWPLVNTCGLWPLTPALFLWASRGPHQGNPKAHVGVSRPAAHLPQQCFHAVKECFPSKARWFWGASGVAPSPFLRAGVGGLHQCQTKAVVYRARSCPSPCPEHAPPLGFGPPVASLWDLCLPGIHCSARGGASLQG